MMPEGRPERLNQEVIRQYREIVERLESMRDQLKNEESVQDEESGHIQGIILWLLRRQDAIMMGRSYAVLEYSQESSSTAVGLSADVVKEVLAAARLVNPGSLVWSAVKILLKIIKRKWDPTLDVRRGYLLLKQEEEPKRYNSIGELIGYLTIQRYNLEKQVGGVLLFPDRLLRQDVKQQLFKILALQPNGPSKLDVARDGTETRTTHYIVGIAPAFEIVEEVITENTRRELRRSLILRRRQ